MKTVKKNGKIKYSLFLINIVAILFVDFLLMRTDKYYHLKYSHIEFIYGIFTGCGVFLLNKYILKSLRYIAKNKNTKNNNIPSKSSILTLLKLFPTKLGFWLVLMFLMSVVLLEELIFRKYLIGFFVYTIELNIIVSVLIVSILFALYHRNLKQIIPLTILGLVFTILVVFTNNLLPAIIAHFVNNLIIALQYKKITNNEKNITY